MAGLSDKDVGLRLVSFPKDVQRFIFPYRRSRGDLLSGRTRDPVFRSIRPDGNVPVGMRRLRHKPRDERGGVTPVELRAICDSLNDARGKGGDTEAGGTARMGRVDGAAEAGREDADHEGG